MNLKIIFSFFVCCCFAANAYTEADLCVNPDANHCYFVSEGGSDTTGIGTMTNPYKTLAPLFSIAGAYGAKLDKADTQVRTVVMRSGNYYHAGTVHIRFSNAVLKNYPGENPRIWLETTNSDSAHRVVLG
ncbi:MAG: hypothetical protein V1835_02535, partial [Candidatus Micrarchaeota archaeon]